MTRAHLIAWRDELRRRGLGGATIRHRLASLFEYLCEKNAVTHNPVKGVERPRTESGEGKTPAIGDHQTRDLLAAPDADTVKSKRDRAILSTLLFHALRREELCKLKVKDFRHARKGVPHLKVAGKGGKTRYLPQHPGAHRLINAAGHGLDESGALFRPVRNNRTGRLEDAINGNVAIGLELRIDRNQIVRSADLDAVPGIIDDGQIGGVRLPRERFQRGNRAFAVEIIRSKRYSRNNRSGEQSCSSPKRPAVGRARNRWGSGRCQGALQVRLTDSGRATTGARRAHFEPKPSKKGKILQRQSNLGVSWSPPSSLICGTTRRENTVNVADARALSFLRSAAKNWT